MCGIAGMMTKDGTRPPQTAIDAMLAAMAHRGPDGTGTHIAGDTALAHGRLSIIDLATGDQPLFAPDGTALIGNGEIYNYVELRQKQPDFPYRTKSDCESPLALYVRDGADFANDLRGMYAIAIHDPGAKRLVLARDPFGIKPLYYAEDTRGFAFASEPQCLRAAGFGGEPPEANARLELLQLQFTTGRDTIFPGIHRLVPGETLIVHAGKIVERRRREALPAGAPAAKSERDAAYEFDRVFEESVRLHQRSDVPYGMFLSGGIDSSAVLAMMARLNERPVTAFTAYFPETGAADERAAARRVAMAARAELIEVPVTRQDFLADLPAIAAAMDDPAADYAIVPTWALARMARKRGFKVVLSGEGGDELFGGYGRYRSAMRPWWMGGRAMRRKGSFDGLDALTIPAAAWRSGIAAAESLASGNGRTRLQVAQAVDVADWLPNDLLGKLDRCLMAHGVEGRTPFLDPAVADFAFRLPDTLKVRKRWGKFLLRKWLSTALPEANAFAPKQGFTVPVQSWIAADANRLGPLVAANPGVAEIVKPGAVLRLFSAASEKRAGFACWTLLFYALWHRRHVRCMAPSGDVFHALDTAR
ncbi:MAG: asparagine synthase (glutamine-hydrolyzing) [Tagaea sp. CACIAM 22H2]|nr:asparagine synthase (glutamine-hydrolyzing) [Tagaea sp. CACIAM 22H2]